MLRATASECGRREPRYGGTQGNPLLPSRTCATCAGVSLRPQSLESAVTSDQGLQATNPATFGHKESLVAPCGVAEHLER
eukprot:6129393-Prymnesium_polylepis.1